jgi:hypothetical protein
MNIGINQEVFIISCCHSAKSEDLFPRWRGTYTGLPDKKVSHNIPILKIKPAIQLQWGVDGKNLMGRLSSRSTEHIPDSDERMGFVSMKKGVMTG